MDTYGYTDRFDINTDLVGCSLRGYDGQQKATSCLGKQIGMYLPGMPIKFYLE